MKFYEWANLFEKKSGEKIYLPPDYNLAFDEEKGFMFWKKDGNILKMNQTCTHDGKYWIRWALDKAAELGCSKARTSVRRNIKAYLRLFGGNVVDVTYGQGPEHPVYVVEWRPEDAKI